ncbi:MAG: hypothetical protein ABEJ95_03970 [Candidatus Nanohalobium sp.]
MKKGNVASILPALAVFISASALSLQSMGVTEAMASEVGESVGDLSLTVHTRVTADNFFYNWMPYGGAYSVHNTTYNLSKVGGGADIHWRTKNGYTPQDAYGDALENLRLKSKNYFNKKYVEARKGLQCDSETGLIQLLPSYSEPLTQWNDLEFWILTTSPLNAECGDRRETKYQAQEEYFRSYGNASDNRYISLANRTSKFFTDLSNSFSSNVQDKYSNTEKACGYAPTDEAEAGALNQVNPDVREAFNTVNSNYPLDNKFKKIESQIVNSVFTLTYGHTTDLFKPSRESMDTWTTENCCDCCGESDRCSPSYWHYARKDIWPGITKVNYTLKDPKYQIPTEEGWRHLEFQVEPYTHYFQKD